MSSAGPGDPWERASATGAAVRDRLPFTDSLVLWGVLVAVVLALVLRLVFLGHRVAHYDEGRVAYWALYTMDTGHFAYRRIIHGPLLQHLDRYLFGLFGATDFLMRFPVAVVGGLLPASALLFRKHLRRVEVVAMAFILALNPVLLYYSRFMRSDILVAAFMFTALGFLVRYYDTRSHWYLYPATAFVVLGFGAKENAIVYVATWLGAAFLLADQALFRPREYDSGAHLLWAKIIGSYRHLRDERVGPWATNLDALGDQVDGANDGADAGDPSTRTLLLGVLKPLRFLVYALVIFFVGAVIFVYIYAPRGAGVDGLYYPVGDPAATLGFWEGIVNPAQWPALFDATWNRFFSEFIEWFSSASDPGCHKDNLIDGWLCYTGRYVEVMLKFAGPMTAFAVFGFLAERYGAAKTRNLALFAAYGGFVAVLGYPLGTDIWGAWIVVHALVPLSIPAAVGVGVIVRWGREAFEAKDVVGVAIAVMVILASVGFTGFVSATSVYSNDQSEHNDLVQYAQPGGDMQEVLVTMEEAAATHDGIDVILFDGGGRIVKDDPNQWRNNQQPDLAAEPMCAKWWDTLPLPWYFSKADAEVECLQQPQNLRETALNESVPVIITPGNRTGMPDVGLDVHYEPHVYRLRTTDTEMTYWIHENYSDRLEPQRFGR